MKKETLSVVTAILILAFNLFNCTSITIAEEEMGGDESPASSMSCDDSSSQEDGTADIEDCLSCEDDEYPDCYYDEDKIAEIIEETLEALEVLDEVSVSFEESPVSLEDGTSLESPDITLDDFSGNECNCSDSEDYNQTGPENEFDKPAGNNTIDDRKDEAPNTESFRKWENSLEGGNNSEKSSEKTGADPTEKNEEGKKEETGAENSKKEAGQPGKVTTRGGRLNVRTGPWGKIEGKLTNGSDVKIIGKEGDWYKIDYNGKEMYVHSRYVRPEGGVYDPVRATGTGISSGNSSPGGFTSTGNPGTGSSGGHTGSSGINGNSGSSSGSSSTSLSGTSSSTGSSGITHTGHTKEGIQQIVNSVAEKYGWGSGKEWEALKRIIVKESNWNPNAQNPHSTAYGLFQFLNSTWKTVGATKTSDPVAQTEAGLKYIKQRYGTPTNALNFHNMHGWY